MKTFDIFGDIIGGEAERWYFSEVSPQQIADFLKEANGEAVEININSNGGSVTGGLAICNMIKQYPGETTCNVLGVAASMASVIACAAKKTTMGEGAFLMVHNPWTYTAGNAEELRKDADTLDKMRDSILGFYLAKCPDKTEDDLKALMDAESWIGRDEAKALGFAIEDYAGELKAAASLTRRAFGKAPDAVKALLKFEDKKPAPVDTPAPAPEEPAQAEEPVAPAEPEKPAEATETASETEKPVDTFEARFKGLSKKFNELKAEYEAAKAKSESDLAALAAERDDFKGQLDQSKKDLDEANAKLSELTAKADEDAKALAKATEDLAEVRDSLAKSEEQVKHLTDTRDMLTAGVLTPPASGNSYADKMKAAKSPEEREALRAQKRMGKIN